MNDFKAFEKNAWEKKSPKYQNTWGRVTNQVIKTLIDQVSIKSGETFLDCGCGPGFLCKAAHDAGANVVGCDYSESMLQVARSNFSDLKFEKQDAENLTYPDSQFDIVTLNYLLLHVANQEQTLREAKRVLKTRGRLAFTNWLAPDRSPGLNLMFSAVKKYADTSVIPPAQDIFMFSSEEAIKSFLEVQGFSKIEFTVFQSFWKVGSPDDFFTAVQAGTRIGGMIDLQTEDIKLKIRDHIFDKIEEFRTEENDYIIPTPSLLTVAVL